jgi:hypothetical protein
MKLNYIEGLRKINSVALVLMPVFLFLLPIKLANANILLILITWLVISIKSKELFKLRKNLSLKKNLLMALPIFFFILLLA